ncbi:hypothetical protein ACKKBF_B09115 [Auxenochlorella protothecoides x Auxenochlorella symbiontica]
MRGSLRVRAAEGESGRQPWEFGRFLRTVTFFNPLDKMLKDLVRLPTRLLFQSNAEEESPAPSAVKLVNAGREGPGPSGPAVLLLGADSDLGARLATTLLDHGRRVQILEPAAAPALASHSASGPGTVELVENGNGLQPGQLADVRFVVAVPGQGAERQLRAALSALSGGDVTLYDAAAGAQGEPTWGSLDDVVMGGASRSAWSWEDAGGEGGDRPAGVFSGEVTTANSGGFASVRTRNFEPALDLRGQTGVSLRLQGDGLRYKLVLRTDSNWDGIAYTSYLDTKPGVWETHTVPFSSFAPIFRAKTVPDAPALQLEHVNSVQLMLSKFEADGALNPAFKTGSFRLAVSSIAATGRTGGESPKLVLVQTDGQGQPGLDLAGIKEAVQGSDIRTLVMHTGRLEDLVQSQAALSVCSGHETGAGPIPNAFVVDAVEEVLDVDLPKPWKEVTLLTSEAGLQTTQASRNWQQLLASE